MVTDRRRLAPEAAFEGARRRLAEQAAWAARAGVDLIQVRERDLDARQLAALVEDCVRATRGRGSRVVVNDRLDVALACGAAGVHLRHDSVLPQDVRRITPPEFVLGRSVHTAAEATNAGPVDYLIAGPVFPTPSKPADGPWLGLDGLAAIVAAAGAPVLAIGGVTRERFDEVAATGAAGIAAIGLFIESFDRLEAPS